MEKKTYDQFMNERKNVKRMSRKSIIKGVKIDDNIQNLYHILDDFQMSLEDDDIFDDNVDKAFRGVNKQIELLEKSFTKVEKLTAKFR